MTLLELCKLLRTKLAFVIGLPVALAVIVGVVSIFAIAPSYEAVSTLTTNYTLTVATGLAETQASNASNDQVTVEAASVATGSSITFTATGSDADACVSAANDAANASKKQMDESFGGTVNTVSEVSEAENTTPSAGKYIAVAFLAGLFIAIVIVVIQDMVVRRVHDWGSVSQETGISYLGSSGGSKPEQERLAVEALLAGREGGEMAKSICLVPVGAIGAMDAVEKQMVEAQPEPSATVVATPPLTQGPQAILSALEADSTVLVVQEEASTFPDLETVVRELGIAGVKPVGFVYVGRSVAKKSRKSSGK